MLITGSSRHSSAASPTCLKDGWSCRPATFIRLVLCPPCPQSFDPSAMASISKIFGLAALRSSVRNGLYALNNRSSNVSGHWRVLQNAHANCLRSISTTMSLFDGKWHQLSCSTPIADLFGFCFRNNDQNARTVAHNVFGHHNQMAQKGRRQNISR